MGISRIMGYLSGNPMHMARKFITSTHIDSHEVGIMYQLVHIWSRMCVSFHVFVNQVIFFKSFLVMSTQVTLGKFRSPCSPTRFGSSCCVSDCGTAPFWVSVTPRSIDSAFKTTLPNCSPPKRFRNRGFGKIRSIYDVSLMNSKDTKYLCDAVSWGLGVEKTYQASRSNLNSTQIKPFSRLSKSFRAPLCTIQEMR